MSEVMARAADRPMIFSAPMVRALLDGRRTQTRRLVSPGTCDVLGLRVTGKSPAWTGLKLDRAWARTHHPLTGTPCPHLAAPWVHPEDEANGMEADAVYRVYPLVGVGDRLWVKETWCHTGVGVWTVADSDLAQGGKVIFRADDDGRDPGIKWFSPLFLARRRSRLTLVVTDVRVQRLQEISCADAIAEGIPAAANSATIDCDTPDPRGGYAGLWNSLHGPAAWDANPWVVALTFDVIQANIDALSATRPDPAGRRALSDAQTGEQGNG